MTTDVDATVAQIAAALGEVEETPVGLIRRIVTRLGTDFATDVLAETRRVEASGGMLTQKRDRRRSPGGVFFYLVRQRLMEEGRRSDLTAIFPAPARHFYDRSERYDRYDNSRRSSATSVVQPLRPRPRGGAAAPRPRGLIGVQRPVNQAAILAIIERHIGKPADLYRRSINPTSGEVTLAFHFPPVARARYSAALDRAAAEAGVPISIGAQAHQGALNDAAREALPRNLLPEKVAIHTASEMVRVRARGEVSEADLEAAVERFASRTGWKLEIQLANNERTDDAEGTDDAESAEGEE